jgi:cytoskeletal protein RodZ
MSTLGYLLAAERLRQNLDLEQVSTVTRISSRMLRAIELDDFGQLPGRVFARNFVRQYAQVLHLDPAAILEQFDREQALVQPEEVVTSKPERFSRGFSLNLPALADVFGNNTITAFITFVATIGVCAGGVWAFDNWGSVRAHVLPDAPASPSSRVASPSTAKKAVSPTQPKAPGVPPPSPFTDSAPETETKAVELDSPALAETPATVHVLLAASDLCWTRITADGKVIFTGILNPGETRQVNAASVVDLRAGNAGGLTVKLNGSDIPPLGPKGQTRTVVLTADGAHVRTPTPDPVSEPL